jgi:ABC-type amino acid transport substrate-binding protein
VKSIAVDLLKSARLADLRIGAVAGSSGEAYGRDMRWNIAPFASLDAALDALAGGGVDAVVHDAPILKYQGQEESFRWLEVSSEGQVQEDYAIALPPGSSLRKRLNVAILEQLVTERWAEIRYKYMGE